MSERALLIRVGALGDTIHACSAAILLKNEHPEMRIDFLVSAGMSPLFSMVPEVDRVFEFSFSRMPYSIHPGWKRMSGTINRSAYTLVYLMETAPRFLPLLERIRADKKITVGGRKGEEDDSHTLPVPVRYQRALNREGFASDRVVPPKLEPSENLEEASNELLKEIGLNPSETLVGLHAGNSYPRRRLKRWTKREDTRSWPEDRWCELIRTLSGMNHRIQFVLFGSALERRVNSRIEERVKRVCKHIRLASSAGKTDLPLAAALLKKFSLFIGTDSGPIHMAAALGVPLIGIYGPTRYDETRPFPLESDRARVVRADLPCQPCYGTPRQKRCRDNICMKAVQVTDVVRKSVDLRRDLFMGGRRIDAHGPREKG